MGDSEMRKCLIIAYDFPPSSTVSSLRVHKFIKHIGKYGWEPYILTRRVSSDEYRYDNDLLNDLPKNVNILRIRPVDLMRLLNKLGRFAFFFQYKRGWFSNIPKSILLSTCNLLIAKPFLRLSLFLMRFVQVFPPDSKVSWIPFVYRSAKKILIRERIDLVFTYGTPHSNSIHLTGYCLKRKFGLPWVVGYDDEWSQHPWRSACFEWQARLDRWLERKVLLAVDRIIATTPSYRTLYSQLAPPELAEKFESVTYSYDESDFRYGKTTHSKDFMQFAYIGSLYQGQTALFFLKALKQLIQRELLPIGKVRMTFAGMVETKLKFLFEDNTLRPIITYHGICSHRDAVKHIKDADVLVLIIGSTRGKGNIPAKTFEYIGSGKPILALVPNNGDAAGIIKRAGTGIVMEPENVEAIKGAVMGLYRQWSEGELKIEPDWNEIQKYECREVTKKLCNIFNLLTPE